MWTGATTGSGAGSGGYYQVGAGGGAGGGIGGGVGGGAGGGVGGGAQAGIGGGAAGAGAVAGAGAGVAGGARGAYATAGTIVAGPVSGSATGVGCCGPAGLVATGLNGGLGDVPAGAAVRMGGGYTSMGPCQTSCGSATGCLAGEECGPGNGMMAFVGPGGGDWVTETTYRYVGPGSGDVMFVSQKRRTYCGLTLCIILAILALALGIFIVVSPTTTTTVMAGVITTSSPAPKQKMGKCIFWGDPHLITFDGARPSFYGDGDYWIIKNDEVSIQGRYMGTVYTYGLAATQKVAIGGPFMKGHTIIIEPMENHGKIYVDGKSVCEDLGSTCHVGDVATLVHDDKGELVDEAASQFDRHMVHLTLPKGIKMTVFRWTNYMDLDIEMPKLEGQDGSCGNFNGDAADDSTQAIFQRMGARVPVSDKMFPDDPKIEFTVEEADMLNTCHKSKLEGAKLVCATELKGSDPTPSELRACMFDECFGMNEHALRTARIYATPEDKAKAGKMSSTA